MSTGMAMTNLGTMPYYQPYYAPTATHILYVGRIELEYEPIGPQINLAPNHQDYTPSHKKNRRGKFKRSGR